MSDSRLNSVHLGLLPRRDEFRQARQALLDARGWLTLAGEQFQGMVPSDVDLGLPILRTTKYLLIDQRTSDAFPLTTGLNTIGRFANNDIVLEGHGISRRHCVILVHSSGKCELHDTASHNGTWVNGRRVQHSLCLRSGDTIQVVKQLFSFVGINDQPEDADEGEDTCPTLVE